MVNPRVDVRRSGLFTAAMTDNARIDEWELSFGKFVADIDRREAEAWRRREAEARQQAEEKAWGLKREHARSDHPLQRMRFRSGK